VFYLKVITLMTSLCAQAQMGSIVTVPWGPFNIRSLEELMESDLNLKAHWKLLESLRNSSDDPVIGEVMARLQPVTQVTELVDELRSQRDRNFAYLMYRRSLEFYASNSVSSVTSSVLKQISVQVVRKFPPKRFLQRNTVKNTETVLSRKRSLIKNVTIGKTRHVVMLYSNFVTFLANNLRLFNF
jgi:hypothetical protein